MAFPSDVINCRIGTEDDSGNWSRAIDAVGRLRQVVADEVAEREGHQDNPYLRGHEDSAGVGDTPGDSIMEEQGIRSPEVVPELHAAEHYHESTYAVYRPESQGFDYFRRGTTEGPGAGTPVLRQEGPGAPSSQNQYLPTTPTSGHTPIWMQGERPSGSDSVATRSYETPSSTVDSAAIFLGRPSMHTGPTGPSLTPVREGPRVFSMHTQGDDASGSDGVGSGDSSDADEAFMPRNSMEERSEAPPGLSFGQLREDDSGSMHEGGWTPLSRKDAASSRPSREAVDSGRAHSSAHPTSRVSEEHWDSPAGPPGRRDSHAISHKLGVSLEVPHHVDQSSFRSYAVGTSLRTFTPKRAASFRPTSTEFPSS